MSLGHYWDLKKENEYLCSLSFDPGLLNISTGTSHDDNNTSTFQWSLFPSEGSWAQQIEESMMLIINKPFTLAEVPL